MEQDAAAPLARIHARIAKACTIARRDPAGVTLIAVSKTHPAEAIVPLIEAGHTVFGENRVQEAATKWPALRERYPDTALHMVGQLQSNKASDAVALFDCIHSLDRPSLARALGKAMDKAGKRVPCFLQVDIGKERQKGGCAIDQLPALLADALEADIPLAGLMCVPPLELEPAPFFALLGELARRHLPTQASPLPSTSSGLSIGMSGDFETAIMLGATHVRVGTALFGSRPA